MQSKTESFIEAIANFFVGWGVYLLVLGSASLVGFPINAGQGLILSGVISVLSVLKSYVIRRYFNSKLDK